MKTPVTGIARPRKKARRYALLGMGDTGPPAAARQCSCYSTRQSRKGALTNHLPRWYQRRMGILHNKMERIHWSNIHKLQRFNCSTFRMLWWRTQKRPHKIRRWNSHYKKREGRTRTHPEASSKSRKQNSCQTCLTWNATGQRRARLTLLRKTTWTS